MTAPVVFRSGALLSMSVSSPTVLHALQLCYSTTISNAVYPAAIGISSGAFGSHGLRNLSPPLTERQISSFSTASSYLIYNGLALLAISFHPGFAVGSATRRYKFAAGMIVGGAVAFSGSIFALVLGRDRFRQLGPVTPLGGVAMIAG